MKLINPEVRIENTSKCNASCIICPRDKMTRPLTTMGMEHFKNIVDQSKKLGAKTISIFGYGEPLLDKELADKIRYCVSKNLSTFITTNGSLLDEDRAKELLSSGIYHIRFSVHGITTDTYESVHKKLKFFPTLRNILNFIEINNRRKQKCKVSISVIPMAGEKDADIVAFWKKNVDWLEIWKPHGWAGALNYRGRSKTRKKTCYRPEKGPVQINADGKMMICCFDSNAVMTVGDTYQNTIEEILKGDRYNEIREIHKSGLVDEHDELPCKSCDQLNTINPAANRTHKDCILRYSSRDPSNRVGFTSSTKFELYTHTHDGLHREKS